MVFSRLLACFNGVGTYESVADYGIRSSIECLVCYLFICGRNVRNLVVADDLVAEVFLEVGHNLQPFGECEGIAYFDSVYIIAYRIAYLFCSI